MHVVTIDTEHEPGWVAVIEVDDHTPTAYVERVVAAGNADGAW